MSVVNFKQNPSLIWSFALLSFSPSLALAEDYTKCMVPTAWYNSNAGDYCAPSDTNNPARGTTFDVSKDPSHNHMVVVIPARNCRTPAQSYQGDIALMLDSSQSLEKTDPSDERMQGTDSFVNELVSRTNGDANQPSLAAVTYGGRLRFQNKDPNDSSKAEYKQADSTQAFAPTFNTISCLDGSNTTRLAEVFPETTTREAWGDAFDSQDSTSRWNEKAFPDDPYPFSICEFLPLTNVSLDGGNTTDLGMTRHKAFFKIAQGTPRGATDISYMLDAANADNNLGGSGKRSKHTIVITDGLPNVPVRRLASYCKSKKHLPNDDFQTDSNSPVKQKYCLDRNFREGVDAAHAKALADFSDTNVHHVLYWSEADESFIDFDEKGTLNPADFLIENSARTGNGKVKFKAAQGPEELKTVLNNLIQRLDDNALQRVEITVTDSNGQTFPKYNAVSASDFPTDLNNPQDQRFDLKILYLQPGQNTAQVRYVYAKDEYTETLTFNVGSTQVNTDKMQCSTQSSSFTVDGDRKDYPVCLKRDNRDVVPAAPEECRGSNQPDECKCAAPTGDGFLGFPDENGNIRVFRNSDSANEEFERQEQFAEVKTYNSSDAEDPRNLRIQGGTGNCGVVGGLSEAMNAKVKRSGFALYGIPFIVLLLAGFCMQFLRNRRHSAVQVQKNKAKGEKE